MSDAISRIEAHQVSDLRIDAPVKIARTTHDSWVPLAVEVAQQLTDLELATAMQL
ncbi:MAG: hypothetical protein ABL967_20250 [Bryobacteraceae bacterium]